MLIGSRTAGFILIFVTITLWTSSNFLASTLFADNTYPKTYLVTWLNTLSFSIFLVFTPRHGSTADRADAQLPSSVSASIPQEAPTADDTSVTSDAGCRFKERKVLNRPGIARSALDFCMLWFSANLFVAIALKYSTVASCTILTSTSGFWTLVLGAFWNVEKFSSKKLLAVILSICGIVLVSSVDIGREKSAGIFPHKSILEVLLGDMMSLASALLYAVYTLLLKTRSSRAGGSGMLVYLGFVGVFAGVLLWPGLVLLNGIGLESLQMPPTRRVCVIVLLNCLISLISDLCWAYATVLLSPTLVTVALSLSIPMSMLGDMVLNSELPDVTYLAGASMVLVAFIVLNSESRAEDSLGER